MNSVDLSGAFCSINAMLLSLVVFLAMFMDSSTSYHVLPTGNFPWLSSMSSKAQSNVEDGELSS